MNSYSCVRDFMPKYLFYALKKFYLYIVTITLYQWNADDWNTCENCTKDWSSSQLPITQDLAHVYTILYNGNKLFVIFLLLYKLTANEILRSHSALCTQSVQIRPIEQRPVLLAHTLCSIPHSAKKNNVRECERGRINKEKYNPGAWFTLSRMCVRPVFLFH